MDLTPSMQQKLCNMFDRQEILDCIHRYCRGMDRMDRELALSAYHPDATNDFGFYVGNAEGLVDWSFSYHGGLQERTHHMVMNHTIELQGDTAHTETYWLFSGANSDASQPPVVFGRYVDRFERRDGKWAIAARVCVVEWLATGVMPAAERVENNSPPSHSCSRDRADVSYERPLRVTDPRNRDSAAPSV